MTNRNGQRDLASVALALSVVLIVYNEILGGALRFLLMKAHAPWLSYVPMVFTATTVFGFFARKALPRGVWVVGGSFLGYAAYTLILRLAVDARGSFVTEMGRVGFALYTWTPFFLGLILASTRREESLCRQARAAWFLAVIGVLMNRFVVFPWTGATIEILGQTTEVARDWSTRGVPRLAGFSRGSVFTANDIAVFGTLFFLSLRGQPLTRLVVWLTSIVAVALTTSKTPLVVIVAVPVMILLCCGSVNKPLLRAVGYYSGLGVVAGLLTLTVALPLASSTETVLDSAPAASMDVGFLTLSSMSERARIMWPGAFALPALDAAPIEWFLGRGIGGIGAAQGIFEPHHVNSADNLFVFLYLTFGIGVVFFAVMLFLGMRRYYVWEPNTFELWLSLSAIVAILAIATNVVESAVPSLLIGLLAGKGFAPTLSRSTSALAPARELLPKSYGSQFLRVTP